MAVGRAKNKDEFIDNVRRRLGEPSVPVQVTSEQFDLIIYDALEFYCNYVYDGSKDVAFILQTEVGKYEYKINSENGLPDNIYAISNMLSSRMSTGIFPSPYGVTDKIIEFYFSMGRLGHGDLVDGTLTFQNLETFRQQFIPKTTWEYNFNTSTLRFNSAPPGDKILCVADQLIDFDGTSTDNNMWNNRWFTGYVMALTKIQWANNLGGLLVSGASIPGGASISLETLYSQGSTEKKEHEDFAIANLGGNWHKIYIG